MGARRCLSCGNGTIPEKPREPELPRGVCCGEPLECGGGCHLVAGHEGPHLCGGEQDDCAGTCPA